jgi:hypothetical protein
MIFKYSDFILNETLKTHNIDFVIDKVSNELSLLKFNYSIQKKENNTIDILLKKFNTISDVDSSLNTINKLFTNRHGWFPSKMIINYTDGLIDIFTYDENILKGVDNKRFDSVKITYEANYDIEEEVPAKLYHLSTSEYKDKILKNGLVPKSKSKLTKHPDRIYVCLKIEKCYDLIRNMNSINENKDWILYEISTKGINDLKLYTDPNYEGGYYLVDNIPPSNIKIIGSKK